MNVQRIKQLAEHLRKPEVSDHFDMNRLAPDRSDESISTALGGCNTAACIAGWAVALFDPDIPSIDVWREGDLLAGDLLGLDYDPAYELFFGGMNHKPPVTNLQAAAVLDHLAETGEVDWSVAT